MKSMRILLAITMLAVMAQSAVAGSDDWTDLFDGESLTGWTVLGGEGDFSVQDGLLVGNSKMGAPNVFLCTDKVYSDFILKYEVKIDEGINSGMQIRSNVWKQDTTTPYLAGSGKESQKTWKAGTVWGYQIELDPSDRAWSGGFYEEGGRGWLVTLAENEAARNAFKKGDWNKFKVKAEGNRFQVWVNGVLAVDTTDETTASGFFGLQLHSIKSEDQVGKKVWWKHIRIRQL